MGINQNVFKLLLLENSYKPITGNFLSIGKHTVSINNNIISNLLKDYGIPFLNNKDIDTFELINKDFDEILKLTDFE